MKLIVFCLFAVCCCSLASAVMKGIERSQESRKLEEVLRHLRDVKGSLQHSEKLLNTPPQNIEDCCCLSALQCFRDNLPMQTDIAEKKRVRLFKSLKHPLTVNGLNFCTSGNNETCQACASHPKQKAEIFFKRLEALIQNAITRLRTN
uniref:interleukin-21 n=1 Tax=Semicossyphus pulcher TaxID=241346 RepID=UPI0037E81A29